MLARSPDFTTCDNTLWGYKKNIIVSKQRYHSNNELKAPATAAFGTFNPAMFRKMSNRTWCRIILCSENEGQHTDVLDA